MILLLLLSSLQNCFSATVATTTTTATVIVAITMTKVSDLNFGSGIQGDAAKTILPAAATAARFTINGQRNRAYTITLPTNVTLITGAGSSPNMQILVNNFVSTPAAGANGLLNAAGTQTLRVGATRAALLTTQVPGTYSTSFTVNVIY